MGTWIRGGELVTATGRFVADILTEDGAIVAIGRDLPVSGDAEEIDAQGHYVLPGGVDVHTHLETTLAGTTTCDDFASGQIAALAGGTTCHIDTLIPEAGQTLLDALENERARAEGKASIDYSFHLTIAGGLESIGRSMEPVLEQGVASFHCSLAAPGPLEIDDAELLEVLGTARENGALVTVRCGNPTIAGKLQERLVATGKTAPRFHADAQPPALEGEGTERAIRIAEIAGDAPIAIGPLSGTEALESVARARARGRRVFAASCPHYLLLDRSLRDSDSFDVAKWIVSPPLRDRSDQRTLWQAIERGDIQIVSSDHTPYRFRDQKERGRESFPLIPAGIPSIEERMKLLYTYGVEEGAIDIERFVALTSTQPARVFGLFPRKGTIAIGSDADLVVWRKDGRSTISAETHRTTSDYSAFEGFRCVGGPEIVVVGGRIAYRDGTFCGEPGSGRFLPRLPFAPPVSRGL